MVRNREILRHKARLAYLEKKDLQAWREGMASLAPETLVE
jgi:hypothetical protein